VDLVQGKTVTLEFQQPEIEYDSQKLIKFTENQKVTIGRDESNDVVLPSPIISRYHAEVEKIGQRYRLARSATAAMEPSLMARVLPVIPGSHRVMHPDRTLSLRGG